MMLKRFSFSVIALICLIAIDQYSKYWIIQTIGIAGYFIEVNNFFNLTLLLNTGISFGIFQNDSMYGRYALIVMGLIICALLLYFLLKEKQKFSIIGFIFALGGGLSNIIDRMRFGGVIDFIDIHIYDLHWPAFNLADSFIFIGFTLLILNAFKHKK